MARADFTAIDAADPLSRLYRQINERTEALRSFESDSAVPTSTVANQFYVDSVNGIFTQRNDDNTEWIFQWLIGQAAHSFVRLPGPTTPSSVTIRTELDTLLNAGGFTNLEEQGADTFMTVESGGNGSFIFIPDPSAYPRWSGRLFAIHVASLDATGNAIRVRLEGSSSDAVVLSRPGDFWIGRIDAGLNWETLATNANEGYKEVNLPAVNVDTRTGLYLVDTSSNSVTLTLPDLSSSQSIRGPISFKKTSASNTMTIDTAGSELIDGAASVAYVAQYSSVTIAVHNQAYWII